jgi:hypothetical protein
MEFTNENLSTQRHRGEEKSRSFFVVSLILDFEKSMNAKEKMLIAR